MPGHFDENDHTANDSYDILVEDFHNLQNDYNELKEIYDSIESKYNAALIRLNEINKVLKLLDTNYMVDSRFRNLHMIPTETFLKLVQLRADK